MTAPRVSVVMSTYNHADFVRRATESVLRQRGVDLEFLIADDGSTDRTRDIVAAIRDERIHFFPNEVNRGACMVTNELIRRSQGEFVALINSDDEWLGDDKLVNQVAVLRRNPAVGASFGRARFTDSGGHSIDKRAVPHGSVFDQENRSQGAWLRRFFDVGNCLCHPTMLIRRSCYDTVGLYDNRLRQLPDFDMWVRLLKHYEIDVSKRELIAFRQLPGQNASAVTPDNSRRAVNEMYFILRRFFDDIPHDVFFDGFGDRLLHAAENDDVHFDIEKALLYAEGDGQLAYARKLIGLEKLHKLLGSEAHRRVLSESYGIGDREFQSMAGEIEALHDPAAELRAKSAEDSLRIVETSASWRLTAPLRRAGQVARRLRGGDPA